MNLNHERELSANRLLNYEKRYGISNEDSFPLQIARDWNSLVNKPKIDLDKMKRVVETALAQKAKYADVAFFTFCNHMEIVLREATQDFLKGK